TGQKILVLFAHFDPHGRVDEYVEYYLQQLHAVGATIIFVSGSPELDPASTKRIASLCEAIYTRKTLALDFGSWHLAWALLKSKGWSLKNFDRFVLANDSVYGPLFDLREMFAEFNGADMYGALESCQFYPHLQSFFLCWDLNERTRRFLEHFWTSFRYITDKEKLIMKYEIGISRQARQQNLILKAYVSSDAAAQAARSAEDHRFASVFKQSEVNYSLYFWDGLIEKFHFPFLKTSLPRNNLFNDQKVEEVGNFITEHAQYPYELIASNLRRFRLDAKDTAVPSKASSVK
ncbi:MAG: rhamnan synthesis F family protein, partial [Janthinobacterium lividum]